MAIAADSTEPGLILVQGPGQAQAGSMHGTGAAAAEQGGRPIVRSKLCVAQGTGRVMLRLRLCQAGAAVGVQVILCTLPRIAHVGDGLVGRSARSILHLRAQYANATPCNRLSCCGTDDRRGALDNQGSIMICKPSS